MVIALQHAQLQTQYLNMSMAMFGLLEDISKRSKLQTYSFSTYEKLLCKLKNHKTFHLNLRQLDV